MLADLQRILARALSSDGPWEALKREGAALPPPEQALLARIDPDAFLLTALLLAKIRCQRICRGDDRAAAWFERDPEAFTAAFRAYARETPPRHFFPRPEAEAFRAFCAARGIRFG